jgi:hypothetical protein
MKVKIYSIIICALFISACTKNELFITSVDGDKCIFLRPPEILPFHNDDTINIKISKIDTTNLNMLLLSTSTTKTYNTCINSNSIIYKENSITNSYYINYNGIYSPWGCSTGNTKAVGLIKIGPIENDINTLTINFNGTAYKGTIVKTGKKITINWPFVKGVIITTSNL